MKIIEEYLVEQFNLDKKSKQGVISEHHNTHMWWAHILKTGKNLQYKDTKKIIDKPELIRVHIKAVSLMIFKFKAKHNMVSSLDDTLPERLKKKSQGYKK